MESSLIKCLISKTLFCVGLPTHKGIAIHLLSSLVVITQIKPWAACESDDERLDGYNGYALTPLYDKLFDRGFITFSKEKHLILSEYLSPYVWKQLNLKNDTFIQQLPMDEKRAKYLEFHHEAVFKGNYAECAKKFGE